VSLPCILLLALTGPVSTEDAAQPGSARRPALTLIWFDVHRRFPAFEEMAGEVTKIFRDVGVAIAWKTGGLGTTFGSKLEIPVILLWEHPSPEWADSRVMGLVPAAPSRSRGVWVFLSRIRGALELDATPPSPGQRPDPEEARRLALATARVVAHEVVHALAPEQPHSRHGLMQHSLDRKSLLSPRQPLSAVCASAVLAGFHALSASAAAAAGELWEVSPPAAGRLENARALIRARHP
jgi:hypothetical protein